MSWQEIKLGDVADMLVGFAFQSPNFLGAQDEGIRILRGDNVQQGYVRWGEKTKKWRADAYEDLSKYQLQAGDVILAMDRPIVGDGLKLAWVKDDDLPCLLVQRVTRIRGVQKKADTNFLRYVLSAPEFKAHIDRITTGANIPHISGKDISAYAFHLPPIDEQERLAKVISNYDDLIETNRRRIALLEESARLLYREWFVKLRFPGHEQVKKVDGVPEGWEKQAISDLACFINRGITPKYDDGAKGLVINQKCIRDGRLSLEQARRQSKEVKPDRLIQLGDVLINSTGTGTLGRVAQVRCEIPDCTVDTHVTIARPGNSRTLGYFGVALLALEPVFSQMGIGATNQTELNRADIGAVQLIAAPQAIQEEFHNTVWPLFEQAETLAAANAKLAQARDALLPKLMSGQLTV